jgi:hypothetical protein
MAEPSENKNPETKSAANENEFKDKPRPITMFRHEASKTNAVLTEAAQERKEVDTKLNALYSAYAPALEAHGLALKQAGEKRLSIRQEAVDNLTAEVGSIQNAIAELQKKLAEEQAKLARSQGALDNAAREVANESRKIVQENKVAYKAKRGALLKDINTVRETRRDIYAKTGKAIRRERWNTFKRTAKEAVAFVPDLCIRFAKATKRGASEFAGVFCRAAKGARAGYKEPTLFSIKRDKPLTAKPQPQSPAAPKQQA